MSQNHIRSTEQAKGVKTVKGNLRLCATRSEGGQRVVQHLRRVLSCYCALGTHVSVSCRKIHFLIFDSKSKDFKLDC